MKKNLLFVFCLLMALMLTACGKGSSSALQDETNKGDTGDTQVSTDEPSSSPSASEIPADTVMSEYGDWSEYVNLGMYEQLVIKKPDYRVKDKDVENAVKDNLTAAATPKQIKTGKVKKGDTVNIDYEGKKDGVAFEGGTAQGADLEIGSGRFIDGFEDGLIDVNVGDTVDLNLTFPEVYDNNPDLAGQPVVFTVKVNYIHGTLEVPELTDEWVTANSKEGSKTVEEYKEEVRKQLESAAEIKMDNAVKQQIIDAILVIGNVQTYPDELVQNYIDIIDNNTESAANYAGMDKEEYISTNYGMSMEEYTKWADEISKSSVAKKMIYETIAKNENLSFTKADLDKKELEFANSYGYDSVEEFEAANNIDWNFLLPDLKEAVLEDVVVEWLKEKADISLVDPSELEEEE